MVETDGTTRIVIVTGPSGAGRITAIRSLEDVGFEAIDNLPLPLIRQVLAHPQEDGRPLAIGVDVRTRGFDAPALVSLVGWMRRKTWLEPTLLFLDCAQDVLLRRFSETRRRHPLAHDDMPEEGLALEAAALAPIRGAADMIIDTSALSPHDLKAELARRFASADEGGLTVSIESFSYKRGIPQGLDMALDCRFLRNPHWEAGLRAKDGRDAAVARYVQADPRHDAFLGHITAMLETLLPAYGEEGKAYFGIGLGCTGGKHRSVYMAQRVAKELEARGWRVSIRHRELERLRAGGQEVGQQ